MQRNIKTTKSPYYSPKSPDSEKSIKNFVKNSFFDEINENEEKNKFWISQEEFSKLDENLDLNSPLLMKGNLIIKSQNEKTQSPGYFELYKNRLLWFKDESKSFCHGIAVVNTIKFEFFENLSDEKDKSVIGEDFCILMTQNRSFELLFALSKEDFDKWKSSLWFCGILTHFQRYFVNIKIIGKGTFAKIGLINEIRLMRTLDHPNIIKLYEVFEGEFHVYLAMELLEGGELFEQIIEKGKYSERDAYLVLKQLFNALDYLHDKKLMHRDIKPENLILRKKESFDLVLADFGLAEYENKNKRIFTRCGTPGYVAPEVLNDKPYTTKVDVFSAGVILYILMTGCSVFSGNSYSEIIYKNRKCIINWGFEKIKIDLSKTALDLLHKMLEKDPEQRISIKEVLQHPWVVEHENDVAPHRDLEGSQKNLFSLKERFLLFV